MGALEKSWIFLSVKECEPCLRMDGVRFFTGWRTLLPPSQQCQNTGGIVVDEIVSCLTIEILHRAEYVRTWHQ